MKRAQGLNKRLRVVGVEATTTKAAKYAAKLWNSLAKQTKRNFDPPGSNGQSSGQSESEAGGGDWQAACEITQLGSGPR